GRLVLVGDSILDNRPYTSPEPETAECLRRMRGDGWTVELLARDGTSSLADIAEDFGARYRQVLAEARPRSRRLVACTIYEPRMFDATTPRLLRVPLTLLNDQIVREAARAGVDVLDLRSVCTSAADFVRQIEPSAQGARRIVATIETVVRGVPSGAAIALLAARA